MTQTQPSEHEHYGPPAMDVFISALGALVIGGVVWGGGAATVAGINYGAELLGIYPPANDLINGAILTGFTVGPILVGLLAAWIAYRFLLNLD